MFLNKANGSFVKADLTLLPAATEIISVAVGNAKLHRQKMALMTDLNHLFQEAIAIARKELNRRKVILRLELADELPYIKAVDNQLHLVFLSLLLNLGDAIEMTGGGVLHLRTYASSKAVSIEFITTVSNITLLNWDHVLQSDSTQAKDEIGLGLSLSYDVIIAHGGSIKLNQKDQQSICCIEFSLIE